MKRRNFLRTSLVGLSSPLILAKSENLKINKNNPVVLSTWNFGLAANEEAIKVLNNGGNSMDAAEKAARHAEAEIRLERRGDCETVRLGRIARPAA